MRRSSLVLAVMAWAPLAWAQAQVPGARPAAPPVGSAVGAMGSIALPPPPVVSDPLLEPPAPAPRQVGSWREALSMVKARSVELRIALADIERAEAQQRLALAGLMPTLVGTASVTHALVRTVSNGNTGGTKVQFFPTNNTLGYGAGLNLTMPLIAPRAWYAQGTAEDNKHVAELSLQEQRRLVAAGVANALVSVITAERITELNRISLRGSLERLIITRRRAELGVANALDVLRLEQDATAARATIISSDETLRQSREALGLALGHGEAYGVPRDLNLDALARDGERGCGRVDAVEDRSDVAAARERVKVARRNHRDVELQFFPTVDLRSSYSSTLQPFVTLFGGFNGIPEQQIARVNTIHSWTISGVLTWNIFDGGVRYAQLRDTNAQTEQAEARLELLRRNATIEVTRAVRGIEVSEQARKVAEQTRDFARETERLSRVSFELGRGTSLELVDAARQLRQAEVQLALREFELVQSKVRALLALSNCDY